MMNTIKNTPIDNFWILQIADFISSFGSSMTSLALTAVIYNQTDSLFATAFFILLSLLPQFLISPFISTVKINMSFRKLFFIFELLCIIPLLILTRISNTYAIYVIYFIYSSLFFFNECYHANYLKVISNEENMNMHQGITRFTNALVVVVGPLLGGILLSNYGMNTIYYLDIVSYILSAFVIHLLVVQFPY